MSAAEELALSIQTERGGRQAKPPQDPYALRSSAIRDMAVHLEVQYAGGCQPHRFSLIAQDCVSTGDGLEVGLVLAHDRRGDNCKAIVRQRLRFSLQPLLAAYRDELVQSGGRVIFHLGERRLHGQLP
jgi:hypothetical protein